jgi:homoserine dehydrogenase
MRDNDVSMESVLQRAYDPDNPVDVVITTHRAKQSDVEKAAAKIGTLKYMTGKPCLMRIEKF